MPTRYVQRPWLNDCRASIRGRNAPLPLEEAERKYAVECRVNLPADDMPLDRAFWEMACWDPGPVFAGVGYRHDFTPDMLWGG